MNQYLWVEAAQPVEATWIDTLCKKTDDTVWSVFRKLGKTRKVNDRIILHRTAILDAFDQDDVKDQHHYMMAGPHGGTTQYVLFYPEAQLADRLRPFDDTVWALAYNAQSDRLRLVQGQDDLDKPPPIPRAPTLKGDVPTDVTRALDKLVQMSTTLGKWAAGVKDPAKQLLEAAAKDKLGNPTFPDSPGAEPEAGADQKAEPEAPAADATPGAEPAQEEDESKSARLKAAVFHLIAELTELTKAQALVNQFAAKQRNIGTEEPEKDDPDLSVLAGALGWYLSSGTSAEGLGLSSRRASITKGLQRLHQKLGGPGVQQLTELMMGLPGPKKAPAPDLKTKPIGK